MGPENFPFSISNTAPTLFETNNYNRSSNEFDRSRIIGHGMRVVNPSNSFNIDPLNPLHLGPAVVPGNVTRRYGTPRYDPLSPFPGARGPDFDELPPPGHRGPLT